MRNGMIYYNLYNIYKRNMRSNCYRKSNPLFVDWKTSHSCNFRYHFHIHFFCVCAPVVQSIFTIGSLVFFCLVICYMKATQQWQYQRSLGFYATANSDRDTKASKIEIDTNENNLALQVWQSEHKKNISATKNLFKRQIRYIEKVEQANFPRKIESHS